MRIVGIFFTALVGLGILLGVVFGVRSVPDMKRYLKMRSM